MNDVKARLEAIAQTQGKRLAGTLHKWGETLSAAIAESMKANTSEPKAAKLAGTHLSPLNWLLIAAGFTGAAAALVIVLGFALLDNTSSIIAPLKERVTTLGRRLDEAERAETALTKRVAAAESALKGSASMTESTIAEVQKLREELSAQTARHVLPPGETAAELADLRNLEKRVAALEGKAIAAGTALANPPSKSAESASGEASFPPFDPVNFTPMLIWLSLSFGVLYLLMAKIALPRVASILHSRAEKITNDIGEANAFRARSEEAAAAHDKTIASAKAKALALAQETHARLNAETEANRLALEAELNGRLAASETQIVAMKAAAMGNVEAIASEAAAAIVSHITGKPADPTAIARAIATSKA